MVEEEATAGDSQSLVDQRDQFFCHQFIVPSLGTCKFGMYIDWRAEKFGKRLITLRHLTHRGTDSRVILRLSVWRSGEEIKWDLWKLVRSYPA